MFKLVLLLATLVNSINSDADTQWHWEDHFFDAEKAELQAWVLHAEEGLTRLVGSLPFTYHVYYHRIATGSGPTPWAHTDKSDGRSVHFYVNTAYSQQVFEKDWTASHELSHLMFPYVGRSGRWFSEGLASYLQYQVMYANDTISWDEAIDNLEERFDVASKLPGYSDASIVALSTRSFHEVSAVRLYWGGAAYFLSVDKALFEEKKLRFTDIITAYLECCVDQEYHNATDMMALFDRISGSGIFTQVYQQTVVHRGFPATSDTAPWLRENPPQIR